METLQELGTSLAGWGDKHFLLKFEKQGRRTYTYGQLAQAARQLAQGLIKSGIRPGDPVGVFSLPDYESVVACLGILQAGASVMPLDLQMETQVLAAVLHDSGARAVFSSREHLSRLQEAGPTQMPIFLLDSAEGSQSWKQLFCENEAVDFPSILPETRAALFYTSGTTGMPKGVPLTHRNLAFQITTLFAAGFIQEHDRVLLPLPLHHVYPFVIGMLFPLAMGLTLVMPASLTGPKLIEAMSAGAVSIVIGVPRLYEALYAGIAAQFESGALQRAFFNKLISFLVFLARRSRLPFGRVLLSSLHRRFGSRVRILASGGALLDSGLAWNLTALGWKVAIGYGLTETAPLLTLKRPDDPHLESVGRPIPGCELRIRHAEDSRYTDVSERTKEDEAVALGEVQAKGPNVFSGYLNLPEVTREVFTEDGWFRTGDLGFFDRQGYLHLRGRVSTMIVTPGGENIQPEDIEEVLNQHPDIRESAVFQRKDGRLAGLIVPELRELRKESGDIRQLIQQAVRQQSEHLASYKRITDAALHYAPLPRTRLGKIRRHLLADLYQQSITDHQQRTGRTPGPMGLDDMTRADRSLLDDPVARTLWEWMATRYADKPLSPDSRFDLDLEVDSLEWLNISMEVQQRTGVEIDEETIPDLVVVRDLLIAVVGKVQAGETSVLASPLKEPEQSLSAYQRRFLRPRSRGETMAAAALYWINHTALRLFFQLQVQGAENIPRNGPFILTPNHVSYLDAFAVAASLDFDQVRRIFWAGWTGVAFRNSLFRAFSRLAAVVPIDAARSLISSLAFAAAVLKQGRGLVWFPEGQRSIDGSLQPFKQGIGILLEQYPVPVIPTFIHGTDRILPRGRAFPRPGRIRVVFGQPVDIRHLIATGEESDLRKHIATFLHDQVAGLGKGIQGSRLMES